MNTKTNLLEQWNLYVRDAMPTHCSEEQMVETRRAFYAGALAYQFAAMDGGVNKATTVHELNNELKAFFDDFKAGKT